MGSLGHEIPRARKPVSADGESAVGKTVQTATAPGFMTAEAGALLARDPTQCPFAKLPAALSPAAPLATGF